MKVFGAGRGEGLPPPGSAIPLSTLRASPAPVPAETPSVYGFGHARPELQFLAPVREAMPIPPCVRARAFPTFRVSQTVFRDGRVGALQHQHVNTWSHTS